MAKDKKSFLLYADLMHTVKQLPDDKAGELFKHILSYVNDEDPKTDDILINIAFEPIKQSMKRDLRKYEETISGRSHSGIMGNLKRYNSDLYADVVSGKITIESAQETAKSRKESQRVANATTESQEVATVADNVNVSVSVSENVREKEINIPFDTFWNLYDKKTSRDKCEKKWKALKNEEREKIITTLPKYISSTPDKKYRKNPETYFNNKTWEDEIISSVNDKPQITDQQAYANRKMGLDEPDDGVDRLFYVFEADGWVNRYFSPEELEEFIQRTQSEVVKSSPKRM